MAHYFGGKYDHSIVTSKSENDENVQLLCSANRTLTCDQTDEASMTYSSSSTMLRFMYLAEFCMGFGVSAMMPLSYSYIDDYSEPGKSSFYFSAIYTMFMFGPLISSVFASKIVKVWVDWPVVEAPENLTEKSHNWVGAWWAGYIIWSIWIFASTIPFFYFPKKLPPQYEKKQVEKEDELMIEAPKEIKPAEKPKSSYTNNIYQVLKNYCFMSIVVHSIFEAYIGQANMLFPKYLEREFDVSPSEANLLGSYRMAFSMISIFLGGFSSSYLFKWNAQTAKKWIIGVQVLILLIEASYFIVSCENSNIVGWTANKDIYQVSEVDQSCGCKSGKLDKVCPQGETDEMYLTACQAQCTDYQCLEENNKNDNKTLVDEHGCWEGYKEEDVVYKNCYDLSSGNQTLDMAKSFCKKPVCTNGENSHYYLVLLSTISVLIQPFLSGATTIEKFKNYNLTSFVFFEN